MKIEFWTFVIETSPVPQFPRAVLRSALGFLGEYMREPRGLYHASLDPGSRHVICQTQEELETKLSNSTSWSVKVNLNPPGWDFNLKFDAQGADFNILPEEFGSKSERGCVEISITTGAVWEAATTEERTAWEDSFLFLATNVIRIARPLWGVRLHEWDFEYVFNSHPEVLNCCDELRKGHVPGLLGRITYLNQELLTKAPLGVLPDIQPNWVNSLGAFISIPSANWEDVLESWIKEVEKSR